MNFKKAIVATLVVSGMLSALAGPIPAGAEAAQDKQQVQQQSEKKKVQIDKTMAAKLQKVVQQFAGKEVKLQDVGEQILPAATFVKVKSIDGKYVIEFDSENGEVREVGGKIPIDKISKKDQDIILKALKEAYAKKTYVFDKEADMTQHYNDEKGKLIEYPQYKLTGKDFEANLDKLDDSVYGLTIKFSKEELDPMWLKTVGKAVKTAFDHDFALREAYLFAYGEKGQYHSLAFEDKELLVRMEAKTGKVTGKITDVIDKRRVKQRKKMTEKEAKETVAPIAKKLFDIDITGYEVKWDNDFGDYRFIQKDDVTAVRAALDTDKNVVYIRAGIRAVRAELY
ncbi:hypothetical protein L3476_17315 [Paenibacillus thiaminolyticus]|uniref:hypothetical protein n=1 Tax=Paenibacillus thiaminolyticus TaxID=49283 RepID=UPI0011631566|nr:hypothetical protein [Paenibacillus thiaminolyticus]NGP61334.1 hypothetical protein [Paenibacillus thiaminolyticus]WCR25124.1 hypothetical protein L3476_17315 [Paenibacillus thiaminolyticus]